MEQQEPMMAVNGVTSGSDVPVVDRDKIGFNGLSSDVFMKLLITQLQNQDPTEPVGNEELLQQLSTMRNLQANIELSDALKQITTSQQLTAGASLLGSVVTGGGAQGEEITGFVDRVFIRGGETFVGMGDQELALNDVTGVDLLLLPEEEA
jgi:flagellar basal-body rod modification protein FlgD